MEKSFQNRDICAEVIARRRYGGCPGHQCHILSSRDGVSQSDESKVRQGEDDTTEHVNERPRCANLRDNLASFVRENRILECKASGDESQNHSQRGFMCAVDVDH